MKGFNKRYLALIVAGAMGLAGCGSDGKDGEDGAPGEPGPGPNPPVVESSEITNVEVIHHVIEEGQVTFEFQITNEDDALIVGLEKVNAELAAMTENGIARSRDDFEGVQVGGSASEATEGASLTVLENGNYEFIAPMPNVTAGTEGIVRLAVGGGEQIAKSRYIVVSKPDNVHTSTTETCQSCHVDYAASHLKHPSYTAINTDGEVDLVAGCMTCHGNVARDDGGYARNTMQKIGHINHQKFETDFTPTNCYTCHAEPVINTSIAGNGCNDCHTSDSAAIQAIAANSDFDAREFHAKSALIGLEERQTIRAEHSATTSAIYMNESNEYCTDLKLFKGEEMLDIEALYADGTLSYASAYLHGYNNASIVGRESRTYETSYKGDGSASLCFEKLDLHTPQIMASSRITFALGEDPSYEGVSFTSYSPVTELDNLANETEYDRRHSVTTDSCTTCHNNETNFHKNGSYAEGGLDCVACHNNGQDRSGTRTVAMDAFQTDAKRIEAGYTIPAMSSDVQVGWKANSAPGFGPLVHGVHWGTQTVLGSELDSNGNENFITNSAPKLNAENCVACHADGIDLYAIPNQFIRAKSFNGGEAKMASPITANCFACHNDDSALNHMVQQGGSIDEEVVADWYTQPTSESCATCHAEGKSYGIEKFHVFER